MATKILLVEDDPDTVEIVELYLAQEDYQVFTSADGVECLRLFREVRPDLIVLDLMLPRLDGIEVCRQVRRESSVPIIMLTARVEEEDRLLGLELGADDYISKPFSPKEVVARVKAVLRRADSSALDGVDRLAYKDINVDVRLHEAKLDDQALDLTRTEMRLLVMFMREPQRVFTREQIINRVLGNDFDRFDRTVDAHISNLRRKLNAGHPRRYIHTIYGVGYKFSNE